MPHRERAPLTRAMLLRGAGFGAAIVLGAIGVWLIVTSNSQKGLEIGVLAGLWGLLLGAYSMFGSRRASQHHQPSDAATGSELATRPSGLLERAEEAAERRAYEDHLEQMLRQEINSTMTRQVSSLRAEIAQLRHDLLEKVGGQLRLERIETTRLIGSDLEALQHEVRQLKVANEGVAAPSLQMGQRGEQTRVTEVRQVIESTRESSASRRSGDDVVEAELVEIDVVDAADEVAAAGPAVEAADDADTAGTVTSGSVAAEIVDDAPAQAEKAQAEKAQAEKAQAEKAQAEKAQAEKAQAEKAKPPRPARGTVRLGRPTWPMAPQTAGQHPSRPDTPAADTPAADTPAADTPAADMPAADMPAADMPAADTPAADMPAADMPAATTRRSTSPPAAPVPPAPAHTRSEPAEPAAANGRQRPVTPTPPPAEAPAASASGDAGRAVPGQGADRPVQSPPSEQLAAQSWADDPFASLPRISPFTDFELDPVEAPANGTASEPSYTGRRRRPEDVDEAPQGGSGRHYRPDDESGGGGRRRADDGETSEDLLRQLMSRRGRH